MTRDSIREGLVDLAEACEKASGPDRDLDTDIFCQEILRENPGRETFRPAAAMLAPRYTASIDAAMSLVPEGHDADVYIRQRRSTAMVIIPEGGGRQSYAATPALALVAAALRAKAQS